MGVGKQLFGCWWREARPEVGALSKLMMAVSKVTTPCASTVTYGLRSCDSM